MFEQPADKNIITPIRTSASPLGSTIYEYEHYSGSSVLVMMGDILIDDAVSISIQVGQNKVPVYGYASPYYSFVADGQISVTGELTVAFKESGYLLFPAKRYNNLMGASRSPRYDKNWPVFGGNRLPQTGDLRSLSKMADDKNVLLANVEQMVRLDNLANGSTDLGNAGFATKQHLNDMRELAALADKDFENYAEIFEDVIWYGAEKENPTARDKLFSRNLPEGEEIDDDQVFSHRRLDQYPPIDIWIIYGDPNHPDDANNHTLRKVLDVSFTGQVQVIEANDEPVYEKYSWIARNFV